jgi:hypothetical protein
MVMIDAGVGRGNEASVREKHDRMESVRGHVPAHHWKRSSPGQMLAAAESSLSHTAGVLTNSDGRPPELHMHVRSD